METLIPVLLALLAIGAFAGFLAGLLGVGGGIVLVPAFYYAFVALGYEGPQLMQVCVASSLATIIVTSARSVSSHAKKGAVDWDILKLWGPLIALGAAIGVIVASRLGSTALQLIFGTMGCVIAVYMAFGKGSWRLGNAMPMKAGRVMTAPAIGFLSVLMGIGGGNLGVPLMTLFGVPIHRAVATAAGFGLLIAIPSVIGFFFVPIADAPPWTIGAVNLAAFAVFVPLTILTAPIGATIAHKMEAGPLKKVFAAFLFLVALNMLREVFFT